MLIIKKKKFLKTAYRGTKVLHGAVEVEVSASGEEIEIF